MFLMPTALLLPILLRIAGPVAFLTAVAAAGIMNRSFMLVPLLAVTATLTTIIIRQVTPSPAMDLKDMLSSEREPKPNKPFRGLLPRLAGGLVGYAIVFTIAAGIAAIFQTTEFEPQLMMVDVWFAMIPAMIAFIGAWISARLGANQMASLMGQMEEAFSQMQTGQPQNDPDQEDAFTFEGEVIDPDKPDS